PPATCPSLRVPPAPARRLPCLPPYLYATADMGGGGRQCPPQHSPGGRFPHGNARASELLRPSALWRRLDAVGPPDAQGVGRQPATRGRRGAQGVRTRYP